MTREQQWVTVLEAVAEACAAEHADGAPTGNVSRRLRAHGSPPARTLLRALRRRGYVRTIERSADGAPLPWALTPAGRTLVATGAGLRRRPSPPSSSLASRPDGLRRSPPKSPLEEAG